jgi:pimeloyl-ACP methyl ester carboxylesterase
MATIVLVPGGWKGGWYFEPLARRLRAGGHDARALTLTGVGERRHLANGAVNLETHIQDVTSVLDAERLEDVVLCGYSYGGMVITGVADRMPERIGALVYVDACVPADGNSCWSLMTQDFRDLFLARTSADGYSVAPPGEDPRGTGHPLASFLQVLRLTGRADRISRRTFVYLSGWAGNPFTSVHERLQKDPRWTPHVLPSDHDVMKGAPDELFRILMRAAA